MISNFLSYFIISNFLIYVIISKRCLRTPLKKFWHVSKTSTNFTLSTQFDCIWFVNLSSPLNSLKISEIWYKNQKVTKKLSRRRDLGLSCWRAWKCVNGGSWWAVFGVPSLGRWLWWVGDALALEGGTFWIAIAIIVSHRLSLRHWKTAACDKYVCVSTTVS